MRGDDRQPDALFRFSYIRPVQRIPSTHPLRPIRDMVDTALRELSPAFARLCDAPRSRRRSCSERCWGSCCTPSGASAS